MDDLVLLLKRMGRDVLLYRTRGDTRLYVTFDILLEARDGSGMACLLIDLTWLRGEYKFTACTT